MMTSPPVASTPDRMSRKDSVKSAPTLGRKRNEKKMSSLREIELWVNQGNSKEISSRTSARNVGLLTENVTEDIMLYSRQCELGRERYKFLVNHAYEKQKFIEHQNKKEKSMKKQMQRARRSISRVIVAPEPRRRLLTIRIPQAEVGDSPGDDGLDDTDGVVEEIVSPLRPDAATSAKEINIVLNSVAEKEVHLPKTINLDKKNTKATYVCTGSKSARHIRERKLNDTEKLPSVKPAVCKGVSYGDRPGSLKSIKSEKGSVKNPSLQQNAKRDIPTDKESIRKPVGELPEGIVNMWASKSKYAKMRKYGQKFLSSVDDPRYVALTSSLAPNSIGERQNSTVGDIIARKDALRGRSGCEGDYRKRLHVKFIAQILQKELSAM